VGSDAGQGVPRVSDTRGSARPLLLRRAGSRARLVPRRSGERRGPGPVLRRHEPAPGGMRRGVACPELPAAPPRRPGLVSRTRYADRGHAHPAVRSPARVCLPGVGALFP